MLSNIILLVTLCTAFVYSKAHTPQRLKRWLTLPALQQTVNTEVMIEITRYITDQIHTPV